MRPQDHYSAHPWSLLASVSRHAGLIWQLSKRDAWGRYRGTVLGVAWSFITPMLMLCIYTFVFSEIFKAKWPAAAHAGSGAGGADSAKLEFAVVLFIGLMVFQIFSDCISKAPTLILNNANYVKKIIFPLEVLPLVSLTSALLHAAINFVIVLMAVLVMQGKLNFLALFAPLALLPLLLQILGISWFLASLGVFWRDVGHTIGLLISGLMFLSPVFFPASAMSQKWQWLLHLSPLTQPIEDIRQLLYYQNFPDLFSWMISLSIGMFVAGLGFVWFQKTRRAFADVI